MNVLKPQSNGLLTQGQIEILQVFRNLADAQHFYLTRGTVLAEFYFGHRRSFDLDLFTTESNLFLPFSRRMEEDLAQQSLAFKVIRRLESFAEFEFSWESDEVRVQLAYDSPYRFSQAIDTDLVKVNDYQDLVVDKLLAFFRRSEPRDAEIP